MIRCWLGELEIGTVSTPVASNRTAQVTFRDVALDLNADPAQYGNGLLAQELEID